MDEYQYVPLDFNTRSFRLLRLCHGEASQQLCCEIFETEYGDETLVPFEALSYAWGNLDTPYTIYVDDKRLPITENLHVALQSLRYDDEDRVLWVDAICIDQKNERERGHQVEQMGGIYGQAEQVIFWLGPATFETNALLVALKRFEQKVRNKLSGNSALFDDRWKAVWAESQPVGAEIVQQRQSDGLHQLLQRPWFQRVWILQEVANAKRAVICAGSRAISSKVFVLAPKLLEVSPDPLCQAVLDIMPGPLRLGSWWSQRRDLYTLLQRFRLSRASDPRDMVYALLGISSDSAYSYGLLQPDYTISVEKVIENTALFLFNISFCHCRNMDAFLGKFPTLVTQGLIAIATSGNSTDVLNYLDNRGEHVSVGTEVLVGAASNTENGFEVMEIICLQPGIVITDTVITAAIQNETNGPNILKLLLELRKDDERFAKLFVQQLEIAASLNVGCARRIQTSGRFRSLKYLTVDYPTST